VKLGAKAIVVGGIEDATLRSFLGYDIGVAITGSEKKGLTVVATEGFGEMRMAQRTFDLFKVARGQDGVGQWRYPNPGRRNPRPR